MTSILALGDKAQELGDALWCAIFRTKCPYGYPTVLRKCTERLFTVHCCTPDDVRHWLVEIRNAILEIYRPLPWTEQNSVCELNMWMGLYTTVGHVITCKDLDHLIRKTWTAMQ